MNIIIITNKSFPEGYASTVRLTTYAEGLSEAGAKVLIQCIYPSEKKNAVVNKKIKGTYNNLMYEYTCGSTIKPDFVVFRQIRKKWGVLNSFLKIVKYNKKARPKGIIIVGPLGFFIELFYYILTRFLGVKFIQERSEYPNLNINNSAIKKIKLFLYLHVSCKLYDAMILISKQLADCYKKYVSKNAQLFLLPIVVDNKRFQHLPVVSKHYEYIAYCGSMSIEKDGMDILLEAFKILSGSFDNIRLKIIGSTNGLGYKVLKEKIKELYLSDMIEFTGRVNNEEMAIQLKNAKLLALARPLNNQTAGNFPTKLGEYLAAGKPIVTTDVGVVKEYLHHKVNAYLAKPSDANDFAAKMADALNNYSQALEIAREGEKLADTVFSNITQGNKLLNFITSL